MGHGCLWLYAARHEASPAGTSDGEREFPCKTERHYFVATFVQTTLTKRTGAGTTVFSPSGFQNRIGYLRAPGTLTFLSPSLTMSSETSGNARRTQVRVVLPQLATDGLSVMSRPSGLIDLYIPEGTLQTDVNDLVGYLNALSATGLTNVNDLLVNGVGVF